MDPDNILADPADLPTAMETEEVYNEEVVRVK
jgi:hypothetical protein